VGETFLTMASDFLYTFFVKGSLVSVKFSPEDFRGTMECGRAQLFLPADCKVAPALPLVNIRR